MSAIGRDTPLRDARARVDGSIPYTLNLALTDMLHAKVLRSPHPHARIRRIGVSAAEKAPGVVAILTGRELADDPSIASLYGVWHRDQPILAVDKVRFAGEAVVAVAAETLDQAQDALQLIEVDYEPLPYVDGELDAIADGAPLVHDGVVNNIMTSSRLRHGDVDAAFAASDTILEERYTSPAAQHTPLEPHVTIAQFEGGRLIVHSATQSPFELRRVLAEIFKLAPEQVRVIAGPLGGGFGSKLHVRLEPIVCALARQTGGRPVKMVATRAEEFALVTKHAATIWIKTGFMRDGRLTAREMTAWWNGGAYADSTYTLVRNGLLRMIGPYRIPAVRAESYGVYTNRPSAGAFRGALTAQGVWAYESHMDSIARTLGMPPLELRRKNLLSEGDTWATGETMRAVHYQDCLDEAVRQLELSRPLVRAEGPIRRGRGVAVMMKSTRTPSHAEARIVLRDDGQATLYVGTVEMGQGAHTALSMIAADELTLPVQAIQVVGPDTDRTPFDADTSSSRATWMMGSAARATARAVVDQLRELGSRLFEVEPHQLALADGALHTAEGQHVPYAELLRRAGRSHIDAQREFRTFGHLDENSQGVASSHWNQAAGACEIEVDIETGQIAVTRFGGAAWAGKVVNPARARAQDQGGIIFGLGQTLGEEMLFADGRVINANMLDYRIPSFQDIPRDIRTTSLASEEPDAEMYGIGEMILCCAAPAVANALYDAVGVRIRDLPLTSERVLRALLRLAGDEGND